MILLLPLLFQGLFCIEMHYHPTRWDPLLVETTAYDEIKNISGWFSSHAKKMKAETFGDLSIITLNLYTRSMSVPTEEQIAAISDILDHAHPTLLCLQGVDKDLMKKLGNLLEGSNHYKISSGEKSFSDLTNGQRYFLPIIYDKYTLKKVNSGYFFTPETRDQIMYASWARFKSYNTEFTAINIDLFSSFKEMTNTEFANIVADITTDPITNSLPAIIIGGIMTMSESMQRLFSSEYSNLVDADPNNRRLVKTTMHGQGRIDDNVQRDFIILRDGNRRLALNYARILSSFPMDQGNHYPVHAILSARPRKRRKGEGHGKKSRARGRRKTNTMESVIKPLLASDQDRLLETGIKSARNSMQKLRSP